MQQPRNGLTARTIPLVAAVLLGSVPPAMAADVSGRVTSDCGAVANVLVLGFTPTGFELACTDASGDFAFLGLPDAGQAFFVFQPPAGYQAVSPTFVSMDLAAPVSVDLDLICILATISGQVVSDCDGALAGVEITLDLVDGTSLTTLTDATGQYAFTDVFAPGGASFSCDPSQTQPPLPVLSVDATGYDAVSPPGGSTQLFVTGDRTVDFVLACPPDPTCIYFESFDASDGGWQPFDESSVNTQGPVRGTDEIHWQLTESDAASGSRGVFWCGTTDPCRIVTAGSAYGPLWDQRLSKTVTLPSGSVSLDLVHRYQTEAFFDFCLVEVRPSGSSSFDIVAQFDGSNGSFALDSVDLSAYAGQSVTLRLRFVSDGAYEEAGGAWEIDEIQIAGTVDADFEPEAVPDGDGESDGWTASLPVGAGIAGFRRELTPPCAATTCLANDWSWVAYDPGSGEVPRTPTEVEDEGRHIRIGVESPPIPLPADATGFELAFCWYHEDFAADVQRFVDFEIVSIVAGQCDVTRTDGFVYHATSGADWLVFRKDVSDLIEPGATAIRIRLLYLDDPNGFGGSPRSSSAPYFDNVLLTAFNTAAPGVSVPAGLTCPSCDDASEPALVSVSGKVGSNCQSVLAGVTVDLATPDGQFLSTVTDAMGEYHFDDLASDPGLGEVSILVPLGYAANTPPDGHASVTLETDQVLDFDLTCVSAVGPIRGMGYWKHQAKALITGRGHAHESETNMRVNFPALLFEHFHDNGLNAIVVEGVTFMDGGAGPEPLDLETIYDTFTVSGGALLLDRAKQHYLALLLNVASGKLHTSDVVSEDGFTASQALQEIADLILDGDPTNDDLAADIAETINQAALVPAETIRDIWDQVAYRADPGSVAPAQSLVATVRPNPFRAGTTIRFGLPERTTARIDVYSATGRRVRTLLDEPLDAGYHRVTWDGRRADGRRAAPATYYVRLEVGSTSTSRKLILLP